MGKIVNLNEFKQNKVNDDISSHLSLQLSIAMHPAKLQKIHPNTEKAFDHFSSLNDNTIGHYSQGLGLLHESYDVDKLKPEDANTLRKLLVLHKDVQSELYENGTIDPEELRPHL